MNVSLASYVKQEYDNYLARCVSEGIEAATWPWQPDRIFLMIDYEIDDMSQSLIAEVYFRGVKEWFYHYKLPMPEGLEPEQMVDWFVKAYTDSFRAWRQTPEDNIILGEN